MPAVFGITVQAV